MALARLMAGLRSPWSLGFSTFGAAYGVYHLWDAKQSGVKYELTEDLTGKTFIVTGATSGIGQVAAEELASRNARVIMACRNREKCVEVRRDIVLNTRNKQVYCRQCDLADFDSIVSFVSKLSKGKFELDRIDGVVHNAAVMNGERHINKDGIETTMATNHLGTFLLTGLLLDKLLAQPNPVRIVFLNTNLIGRKTALDFDNFNEEELGERQTWTQSARSLISSKKGAEEAEEEGKKAPKYKKWDGYEVYKRTKLAEAMFARDLSEKLKDTNITVLMADPGRSKSNLSKQLDSQQFFLSRWLMKPVSFAMGERKTHKAVRPVLYAVADPAMAGKTGLFLNRERQEQEWGAAVEDKETRQRLWVVSEKWTRFSDRLAQLRAEIAPLMESPKAEKKSGWWFW